MLERAAGRPGQRRPDGSNRGAGVAELADALDLGSSDENRGGSNPPARTSDRPRRIDPEECEHAAMNVTETSAEGLKREFKITIPASEVEEQITKRLGEIARAVRIPGFRPGKVPLPLLRKRYGQAVRGEVLESAVQDSSAEAMRERNLRPAMQPRVELISAEEGADLEYKMSLEVLPDMPEPDFSSLGLEKLVPELPDEDIDKALERLAEQQRKTEPVERPAEIGDIVVADMVGHVGDTEIPGSRGEDRQIELGAEGLLPGFTEQLLGAAAGDKREVRTTFPSRLRQPRHGRQGGRVRGHRQGGAAQAAGRDRRHARRGGRAREPGRTAPGDPPAHAARLRGDRPPAAEAAAARQAGGRQYDFPVPPGMVEMEFNSIWAQYEGEKEARKQIAARAAAGATAADEPARGRSMRLRSSRRRRPPWKAPSERAPASAEAAAAARRTRSSAAPGPPRRPAPGLARRADRRGRGDRAGGDRARRRLRHRADRRRGSTRTKTTQKRAPNSSASPSGGSDWGCCLPRSAATTILRSVRKR